MVSLEYAHSLLTRDTGTVEGLAQVVMALASGQTPADRLARDAQRPVADALQIAHDAGLARVLAPMIACAGASRWATPRRAALRAIASPCPRSGAATRRCAVRRHSARSRQTTRRRALPIGIAGHGRVDPLEKATHGRHRRHGKAFDAMLVPRRLHRLTWLQPEGLSDLAGTHDGTVCDTVTTDMPTSSISVSLHEEGMDALRSARVRAGVATSRPPHSPVPPALRTAASPGLPPARGSCRSESMIGIPHSWPATP